MAEWGFNSRHFDSRVHVHNHYTKLPLKFSPAFFKYLPITCNYPGSTVEVLCALVMPFLAAIVLIPINKVIAIIYGEMTYVPHIMLGAFTVI